MANKVKFMSQKGTAQYPWLNRPDTAYHAEGQYKVNIKMSPSDGAELMKAAQQFANDNFGTKGDSAKMPWKIDTETGEVVFTAKSKYKPKFVDSRGQIIAEDKVPQIFGGSELKMSGNFYPYSNNGNGVSLQLGAVQIITLAESTTSTAFAPVDDGFVASNDNGAEENSYNF